MNSPLTLLLAVVGLSSVGCDHAPPGIQVLSPSEFNIILPERENGTLMMARVGINEEVGLVEDGSHLARTSANGRVINFSEKNLELKRGDRIYYSLLFVGGGGRMHESNGDYTFDGVYKRPNRRRREIYEFVLEGRPEETNLNQHDRLSRYGHEAPHGYFNPHGRPNGPPHGHFHHHPPPHHGHGAWKGHGDHFGNEGPWDGHGHDGDCDTHGNNPPKYPPRPDTNKPWGGDNPYQGTNNNGGFDNPYDDKKNKGNGVGGDNNDYDKVGTKNNKGTDNPNVEVFTTKRPSTTQRTTTVPDIDIRFRVPEDS